MWEEQIRTPMHIPQPVAIGGEAIHKVQMLENYGFVMREVTRHRGGENAESCGKRV